VSARVYSVRLLSIAGLQGEWTIDVPPGWTVVVRQVTLYGGERSSGSTFRLIDGITTQSLMYFYRAPLENPFWANEEMRVVFTNPNFIVAHNDGDPTDVYIGGYALEGEAPPPFGP